jgi:hypothetical protein
MKNIDGASSVLAYNYFPSNGDMVLDRSENWSTTGSSHRFLRNIVTHENGHGIGLAHVCCNTHTMLMEPFLSTAVDGPQHDDIRAAKRHYGDPNEDDNTAGTATNLGALTSGVPLTNACTLPAPISGTNPANTSNCSIDADGEQDYYRFSVSTSSKLDVTVTPLGFSYNDNAQSGGSCPTGSTTNSLTRANLNVQVIGSDGSTVLATAASQPVGTAESLTNVTLPAPGDYYIRVYEGDVPVQSQIYSFTLTATAAVVLEPTPIDDVAITP